MWVGPAALKLGLCDALATSEEVHCASSKSNASIVLYLTLTITLYVTLHFTLTVRSHSYSFLSHYLLLTLPQISILISLCLCLCLFFLQLLSLFSPHLCMPTYFSSLKNIHVPSCIIHASLPALLLYLVNLYPIPSHPNKPSFPSPKTNIMLYHNRYLCLLQGAITSEEWRCSNTRRQEKSTCRNILSNL